MKYHSEVMSEYVIPREIEKDEVFSGVISNLDLLSMYYKLEIAIANRFMENIKEDNYNYIPFSHLAFFNKLKEVKEKYNPKSFIDIGSGIGTKLYIAKELLKFDNVSGVEIEKEFIKICKLFVPEAKIYNTCLTKFEEISNYDVVYTYTPIKGFSVSDQNKKIKEKMKPGSVYLEAMFNNPIIRETIIS